MMIKARSGRSWVKLSSFVALGYYALAVTTLLLGYLSESDKALGVPQRKRQAEPRYVHRHVQSAYLLRVGH